LPPSGLVTCPTLLWRRLGAAQTAALLTCPESYRGWKCGHASVLIRDCSGSLCFDPPEDPISVGRGTAVQTKGEADEAAEGVSRGRGGGASGGGVLVAPAGAAKPAYSVTCVGGSVTVTWKPRTLDYTLKINFSEGGPATFGPVETGNGPGSDTVGEFSETPASAQVIFTTKDGGVNPDPVACT
jgi:hypothetical protein